MTLPRSCARVAGPIARALSPAVKEEEHSLWESAGGAGEPAEPAAKAAMGRNGGGPPLSARRILSSSSIGESESLSCSTSGCSMTATFDLSACGAVNELYLSITEFGGDFSDPSEYAVVYVGSTSTGKQCSSGNDCGASYTCLSEYDITSYYAAPSSSTVSVTLEATSAVNYCSPYMYATVLINGTCLVPTAVPTATPVPTLRPTVTLQPTPPPSLQPSPVPTTLPTTQYRGGARRAE